MASEARQTGRFSPEKTRTRLRDAKESLDDGPCYGTMRIDTRESLQTVLRLSVWKPASPPKSSTRPQREKRTAHTHTHTERDTETKASRPLGENGLVPREYGNFSRGGQDAHDLCEGSPEQEAPRRQSKDTGSVCFQACRKSYLRMCCRVKLLQLANHRS